jgi:endonuclease YncB( thermonuclease family)
VTDAAKAAGPPPPPPIALKYYGFSTARNNGRKVAFFLDGDEISVAGEGETVKKRYRVVRIGVNSVLMEDTESKRQQSLPLTEEQPG